jgi:hypothetical protein
MRIYTLLFLTLSINLLLINTQACNLITPTSANDCTAKSVQNKEYCCYLNAPNLTQNAKLCHSIPFQTFSGDTTYYLNGNTYFLDCGTKKELPALSVCQPAEGGDPTGQSDCATGSSFTNSCCYNEDTKKCYWLGTKYDGITLWASLRLDCNGYYFSVSMMMVFSFIAMLI